MKRVSDAQCRQEIIAKLIQLVEEKLTGKKAKLIAEFIRQYYSHVALDDLYSRSLLDLYGAALSHWNFLFKRKSGEVKLRIFNPDYEEHGWSSTHTIVELIQDDMPFLVDSLAMELNRQSITSHLVIHLGGMLLPRDKNDEIQEVIPSDIASIVNEQRLHSKDYKDSTLHNLQIQEQVEQYKHLEEILPEAPIYIEIDRQNEPQALKELQEDLQRILHDVKAAVDDWHKVIDRMNNILVELEDIHCENTRGMEIDEAKEFLRWMANDHFTFLGCRDYELTGEGEDLALRIIPNSGLGVLRNDKDSQAVRNFSEMPPVVRELALSPQILIVAKSNTLSTVHRPAYTDYISVKRKDKNGETIGETRFIGLFTSTAYSSRPKDIPFLRNKVKQVLHRSHLSLRGHAGKALLHILETFPRDDLFQASVDELYDMCMEILHMQERQKIRLFVRQDIYRRFISCLVYVPRELYNTDLRRQMQDVLEEAFHTNEVVCNAQFSESVLARIHFLLHVRTHQEFDYDIPLIEKKLIEVGRSWRHELRDDLVDTFGDDKGNSQAIKYQNAFPASYRECFSARNAVYDIQHLEGLISTEAIGMSLYQSIADSEEKLRFKLLRQNNTIPLSDALPVLENLGLRVIGEQPHRIQRKDGQVFWINDFEMVHAKHICFDVAEIKDIFQDAFHHIWFAEAENDGFNYLVLIAKLSWRQTVLLRAYAKYFRQMGFTFSQQYIEATLRNYSEISKQLVELFDIYFNPSRQDTQERVITQLERNIEEALDLVANMDEDRILRQYYRAIRGTVRTNYYQKDEDNNFKSYISFKIMSKEIPDMPLPLPMYEIFVYSPRFEGIHLRAAKVARGGIRWSDRREDFRTEILGLMKAQQVKNAVIVPQGAKGGFVPKLLPADGSREEVLEEGIECYKNFIRGLLDITDNLEAGEIVMPKDVVRYDDDDPYLVVAADKGTATFSDIANSISQDYGFWLDDAFASGGSTGYDHKKIGITARGAWESVKRHFRHLETDIQNTDFTVVGIGDMGGDVFGNGMLLSRHIRLVAAFNHMHIFVDPNPDATKSYAERERLFKLPRSSWEDYNSELISEGGGVFRRSAKFIRLTPEIKVLTGLDKDFVLPNDLIKALLKAEVDLLWSGGIGTFVKAEVENNNDVGDRTNDAIRVNGNALRCKVIGEGGNLGFTQLARVEYELSGGLVYTDFIDNSAGVDCSDHEVNIKILLNIVVANGDMTGKQRNNLLAEMTDEIANLVLMNNYHQTQSIEISMHNPPSTIDLYSRYIHDLEQKDKLDPELEFLPDQKVLAERKANNQGFTRPEISVLLAYSKNILKQDILETDITELPELNSVIEETVPRQLQARFDSEIEQHSLRREIIATRLANIIVNDMGSTFVHRMQSETGAPVDSIVRAYLIARKVFDRDALAHLVERLDNKIAASVQVKMLLEMYRLVLRGTRWFLRNRRHELDVAKCSSYFSQGVSELKTDILELIVGSELESYEQVKSDFIEQGGTESIASEAALMIPMLPALDVIEAARQHNFAIKELAEAYFVLGDKLGLSWIRHQIRVHAIESHWDGLARSALRDDLDRQQRNLSVSLLLFETQADTIDGRISEWLAEHQDLVERWLSLVSDLRGSSSVTFTMYLVAVRELMDLTQTSLNIGYVNIENQPEQAQVVSVEKQKKVAKNTKKPAKKSTKKVSKTSD